jgi:hypothetical protein
MANTVAGVPGADPTLPKVPIELNGTTYHLAFDFNSLAMAEKVTGINPMADEFQFSPLMVRGLLWASLLPGNPGLTLEQVGSWIRWNDRARLCAAIVEALRGSQAEPDPEKAASDPQLA